MTLSEAVEVAGQLIDCYPNGGANAGDGYIGALAQVLGSFPRSVAERVADPLHGVPRETRFLPFAADVVAWCERETAKLRERLNSENQRFDYAEQIRWRKEEELKLIEDRKQRPTGKDVWARLDELWPNRRRKEKISWGMDAKSLMALGSMTPEQWDLLPDAKEAPHFKRATP